MHPLKKLVLRCVILGILMTLSKSIAIAGDYASREIIGFSPGGEHFAFEQFGVQDGSGFPYSEIFIIDTRNDSWVPGTPVRIMLENENKSIEDARQAASVKARKKLQYYEIMETGEHLASNPRAEISADPYDIAINAAYEFSPPTEDIIAFTLKEKTLESAECSQFSDQPVKGFRLTMQRADGKAVVLHDDETLPKSRGCVLSYAFADVYRRKSDDAHTYVLLLHLQKIGFEGPDGRFLAVTRRLPLK